MTEKQCIAFLKTLAPGLKPMPTKLEVPVCLPMGDHATPLWYCLCSAFPRTAQRVPGEVCLTSRQEVQGLSWSCSLRQNALYVCVYLEKLAVTCRAWISY